MIVQKIDTSLNRASNLLLEKKNACFQTWVLADAEKTGTINQVIGFANKLGISHKKFFLKKTWPCFILPKNRWKIHHTQTTAGNTLKAPWPDLVIACGNAASAAAAILKKKHPDTVAVCLMNPRLPLECFDVIIAQQHDDLSGKMVLATNLATHTLTDSTLLQAKKKWESFFKHLPHPHIGVLLGGKTKHFKFSRSFAEKLATHLKRTASQTGGSLLITPSRRTPQHVTQTLNRVLHETPNFLWNKTGDNPYKGIIASADYIIATNDSTQMLSEAAFLETPLYIYPTPKTPKKIEKFLSFLYQENSARPFQGELTHWMRPSLKEDRLLLQNFLERIKTKN